MISRTTDLPDDHASRPIRRFLTLGIDVAGLKCVVVGGGRVGTRKAVKLIEHGANVVVCSPQISPSLRRAVQERRLAWERRPYERALLRGVRFVVAATDDKALNLRIARDAERRGIPFCLASDRSRSRVIFPATCGIEDLVIAVHTNGRSPKRATEVRNLISRLFCRLPQQGSDLCVLANSSESAGADKGKVYIVGAGPGAADLITVRGLRAIRSADVVIFDRILGRDFAEQLGIDPHRREVEWLGAGRMAPGRQAEINGRILEAAAAGKVVARVKNGDPFVFGRGAEEIDFLAEHGITFEVIPGISSVSGALTAAGYALTSREHGRSFAVTSAQLAGGRFNEHYPKADSLVVLMVVGVLDRVVGRLVAEGWSPDTPAVIIERGTQDGEREVVGRLRDIARLAKHHNIESPAVLALGVVAARKLTSPKSARRRVTRACAGEVNLSRS